MPKNLESARISLTKAELQQRVTELESALQEQKKLFADYRRTEETYRSLFKNMLNGIAHCRMVFKDGEPDDFIFLTVNEAFETLTGLKDVIGKRVRELFPAIMETDPKIFEIFSLVSLSGQPERFEIYLEAAKEWISVSVYSPEEEHFVAIFDVITKKKKTEQALRDSLDHASRLSNLLELSSQPFAQGFPDGSLGLFNKAFVDLTGYTREELANLTWKELTPPEWHPLEQEKLERLHATGEAVRYQKEYIRKDGSRVPVEIFAHLIREKDGKPKYYYSFVTDVTERRRAQKSLQTAYTKYKMLFQSFPLGITIADNSGQIIEANRMAENILGISSDEQKRRHIDSKGWQIVRPDGSQMPPEEYASVRALKEDRLIEDVEMGIVKPSGAITWLSVAATPIPLDEGGLIITYLDITERKRMQDDLRWSEERLHLALNAANAGTWEWDLRTNESTWSEELWELYRMRPHSSAPSFDIWLETVHPDDRDKAEEALKDAVHRGTKLSVEWRVHDPVGKDRWLMLRGRPAYDIAGRIGRFIGISIDITDRKKAELALKESEQKFKIVADNTYDFEYWLDPNGNYIYASPSCERICGYSSNEFISDPSLQRRVVHPEDITRFDEHLHTVEATRTHGEVEFRIMRKDGGIRWIEHACQPVFDEQGHYLGVRGSNRDVTDRKLAEEAHQQSERNYREIFNATNEAIFLHDAATGAILDVNDAMLRMFGYETKEVITGRNVGNLSMSLNESPFTSEEALRRICQAVEHGSLVFEWHARKKNGDVFWVEVSLRSTQIGGEGRVLAVVRDITERKQAEEALRESEEKLRLFIDHAPAALAMFDRDMRYLAASIRWIGDYGLFNREIIGQSHYEIFPEIPEHWKEVHRRGLSGEILRNEEDRFERQDGSVQWLRWEVRPWHTASGDVGGIVIFAEDITGRKNAEEEMKNMQLQLAEARKMESVGRLAGGVAHEFNNMLNVIIGYAELGMYKVDPSMPLYDNLTEILKAANRSAEITRKLLAFAQKQIFLPKVVHLNELVESVLLTIGKLIGDEIELNWLPAEDLYPVKVSPVQVDQILTNLCLNARDAISGHGRITIQTANETLDENYSEGGTDFYPGDFAVLSVSDTGCGMDKETLKNIFEPFFTTKEVGKGTGLGMPMVYGIVRQNNGLIAIDSEPGKGTTVKIYLPRSERKILQTNPESAEDIPVGHGETVLLVEDEHQVLTTSKLMLEKLGYHVLAAETPEEAISLAKEINLLITDVVMPKMNGHDLAKHLHGLYPDMKILYVSGYTANVITEQGMLEKFDNFLQKPFHMRAIAVKVREILDKG